MTASTEPICERNRLSDLPWLFSPAVDLVTFLGSALLALLLLALGAERGWLDADTPEWLWVSAILMIDVAHVYATGFRVYFDRSELARRPWLYGLTPLLCYLLGVAVYSEGSHLFWRALAYLAVFHFVRQQYGWVALYRARAGDLGRWNRWIDNLAIYLATVYPLTYWHAHLPREFWWFLPGDFVALPQTAEAVLRPIYWAALIAYAANSLRLLVSTGHANPGKDIIVATTALTWHVGIITFNSDYAFTVTNVIVHGVPYLVLVFWFRWCRTDAAQPGSHRSTQIAMYLGLVWLLAYIEELAWHAGIWHERAWLFGPAWNVSDWAWLFVPLLSVPQLTHYILDGFIWRRRNMASD